jgi:hypothetical protein
MVNMVGHKPGIPLFECLDGWNLLLGNKPVVYIEVDDLLWSSEVSFS